MGLGKPKHACEKPGNYLKDLQDKLKRHQRRLTENKNRLRLVHPAEPDFDQLIDERNSITVDIQTAQDRIRFHNKPAFIPQVQFLTQK